MSRRSGRKLPGSVRSSDSPRSSVNLRTSAPLLTISPSDEKQRNAVTLPSQSVRVNCTNQRSWLSIPHKNLNGVSKRREKTLSGSFSRRQKRAAGHAGKRASWLPAAPPGSSKMPGRGGLTVKMFGLWGFQQEPYALRGTQALG